jgi:uncharacterized protein
MNHSSKHGLDTVAWHKQFWPWFLIILLSVSVLSSLVTVYYAVRDPDPIIDGNYYKHGLTINEQFDTARTEESTQQKTAPPEDEIR